jgi:hypothetical protein
VDLLDVNGHGGGAAHIGFQGTQWVVQFQGSGKQQKRAFFSLFS